MVIFGKESKSEVLLMLDSDTDLLRRTLVFYYLV